MSRTSHESTLIRSDPATTRRDVTETDVGSVFVSNYPPYSFWRPEHVDEASATLQEPFDQPSGTPLGLYLHIPFCRKRCKFCYFKVYTDKNSDDIQTYIDALVREIELYAETPKVAGRQLLFVYFGGGTPSYISAKHLKGLARRVKDVLPWDDADEVAFECEPGTLTQAKLAAIKDIGVTRLSLGVENLNDEILRQNGRAHLSKEVVRVIPWIHELEFDEFNVDLIAGMVGETQSSWTETVRKTVDLDPDSITVYQLELPFNAVYSQELLAGKPLPVADWDTKRAWHSEAFDTFAAAGYVPSSAYTMVKAGRVSGFVYRDAVWRGSDMIGAGVASFSHMSGVHFQNVSSWEEYVGSLRADCLPIGRAFPTSARERLTREMILQLKHGRLDAGYFREKFQVDILKEFDSGYRRLEEEGMLTVDADGVRLTREGLLRVDQLLPEFYDPKYSNARYT